MRSSARPVLLRSLKVIGGATASSSEAVAATCFGFRANDEIRIESVLPSRKVVMMDILDSHEQARSSLHLSCVSEPTTPSPPGGERRLLVMSHDSTTHQPVDQTTYAPYAQLPLLSPVLICHPRSRSTGRAGSVPHSSQDVSKSAMSR